MLSLFNDDITKAHIANVGVNRASTTTNHVIRTDLSYYVVIILYRILIDGGMLVNETVRVSDCGCSERCSSILVVSGMFNSILCYNTQYTSPSFVALVHQRLIISSQAS